MLYMWALDVLLGCLFALQIVSDAVVSVDAGVKALQRHAFAIVSVFTLGCACAAYLLLIHIDDSEAALRAVWTVVSLLIVAFAGLALLPRFPSLVAAPGGICMELGVIAIVLGVMFTTSRLLPVMPAIALGGIVLLFVGYRWLRSGTARRRGQHRNRVR